ncbi:AAA family ATPase [Burkholderia aenigmatica]|uniref:AAA family ATPase n=1 Tax=Burkholderia aenigmatica TaxID=2015348 RepID=UPI001F00B428|nr:AAA family ATPase [Burkholderia aenigmatica]UKD13915.1 AAA family ATPase [Burkholderia aenigmatica]
MSDLVNAREENTNTEAEKHAFRAWLLESSKLKNTAAAYVSGVNSVSKHYGTDVFGISNSEQLQKLLDDYGIGGIYQNIGNQNSGSVRSGIREWVNFCRTRSADQCKTMSVKLTEGAIKNGYITVNGSRDFFPQDFVANDSGVSRRQFTLVWPDGHTVQTCILGKHGRIQARFNSRFQSSYQPGTILVIKQDTTSDAIYHISAIAPHHTPETEALITMTSTSEINLNQILYGPPGTGKTYRTIEAAIQILDPEFFVAHKELRGELKARFDELAHERRVRFVTFHQSFSYEDFVEGLRAYSDDNGQLQYKVEDGVFKQIVRDAQHVEISSTSTMDIPDDVRIWKISIGGAGPSTVKSYCLQHGEARIGWPDLGDMRNPTEEGRRYLESLGTNDRNTVGLFSKDIAVGDVLVSIDGRDRIGAVGVVTREYAYDDSSSNCDPDYPHTLKVDWLYTNLDVAAKPLNDGAIFALKAVYPLLRFKWPLLLDAIIKSGAQPNGNARISDVAAKRPYVLVIDEINRGSTSRIFGELITLIEPSKRLGNSDALEVVLPYSKESFGVPENLYIIGTMNTADRSLSGLDIALRRRFSFVEMTPQPELLDEVEVSGVNVGDLLRVINRRIEVLLDREHCIGHAYFMPLVASPDLDRLADIFRRMVLPLLQEYFFEDWKHIQWVLNDHRKMADEHRFIREVSVDTVELFGHVESLEPLVSRFEINHRAFDRAASYAQTISSNAVSAAHTNKTALEGDTLDIDLGDNR